jgi:hypothetical protein
VKPCVAVPAEFDDFGRRLAAELADFPLERRRNVEDRSGWWGMNGPAGRRPPGGTTMANKTIISCAITGSIHTPTMSDALPITPDQIATQAIDAAKAGAAILHLHARDPLDGRPSPDPNVFMQFLPRSKQSCDAVVNITPAAP